MLIHVGCCQRNRRHGQNDSRIGINAPKTIDESQQVLLNLLHRIIPKAVDISLPNAPGNPRSKRQRGAVRHVFPALR